MILVDTSVWVAYFKGRAVARGLREFLERGQVLIHPWVVGELLLGNLGGRSSEALEDLQKLPPAPLLSHEELVRLVRARKLSGCGIGWVDAQLLGSALLADALLWTLDGKLRAVAARCRAAVREP